MEKNLTLPPLIESIFYWCAVYHFPNPESWLCDKFSLLYPWNSGYMWLLTQSPNHTNKLEFTSFVSSVWIKSNYVKIHYCEISIFKVEHQPLIKQHCIPRSEYFTIGKVGEDKRLQNF